MIPTPEQLAAVLPRVEAGLDSGDWSDDADRLAWATKVLGWVEEAVEHAWHRDPHEVLDGDTWLVRGGKAVITRSNDWPPPDKVDHFVAICSRWNRIPAPKGNA